MFRRAAEENVKMEDAEMEDAEIKNAAEREENAEEDAL